jgi:hypothetical protein
VEYALRNVEKGVFRPQISTQAIIQFVGVFIDGVAQSAVFSAAERNNRHSEAAVGIPELFQAMAMAVANFLEV